MYQVWIEGKKVGEFTSFRDAFQMLFREIEELGQQSGYTPDGKETQENFLIYEFRDKKLRMSFPDAIELACENKIFFEGKVNDCAPNPPEKIIRKAFLLCTVAEMQKQSAELVGMLKACV